ncbi:MAG: HAMP domain-containing histidine kinase [Magnetospirillum sp.]|nr:MAG: HAMP domain-containing histidine kinase [Magnetospirillum sp.]
MTASLSVRLVIGALIWLAVMLAVGGGVLALAFRDTVEQEFSHRLDAMLRAMIAATEIGPDGTVTLVRPLGDSRFDQIFSGWYWQITEPSERHIRSRSLWDSVITPTDGGTELQTRRIDGPRGELLLVVERDLRYSGAAGPIHLQIAGDLREVRDGVRRFDLLLGSALGLLGVGMAIAILIQVRFGLRPLRAMAADLGAVRRGERDRLSGGYPREVAPLAEAMNGVLDRDAELIERARTHVGNLAHGLKTPLTVIAAEMAGGPDREVVGQQVQAMRRLIEHHLGRASAVAGAGRVLGARVPVGEVADAIAGVLARIFAGRGLVFDTAVPVEIVFRGHREDLEEILGNLMENACKWAAGRVRVSGRDTPAGLVLAVEDDGPGMPPELAAEASRRGKRFDEMASGWGLGLSIVSDLVEVNGGEMGFSRSDLGGLAVTIRLPSR